MNNFQQNNPQNKQNYQQKQQQYNTSNQGKLSNLNFWEDETKEKVNLKIFDEAEKLVDNYKGMTTSQLRNFYNEVKNIEKIKERSDIDDSQIFNLIMIRLKLLKAKLNYNQNRSINKRNQGFKNFSSDFSNILDSKIKTLKDFDVFCKFFEALVGYFYGSNQ
ncbi:MAG TPA: type III-A CRISPR-associated protein Csm2 [Exilispira sp.]|nr:type III-A CRISPR-associated protein Csm2 [Exilispira sp.]